jgi:ribonuclease HII
LRGAEGKLGDARWVGEELNRGVIGGIDEAGRGALVGPLVIAGVSLDEPSLSELKLAGVKDSKKLSPARRERLAELIRERAKSTVVVEVSPHEIDMREKRLMNLNTLELLKMAQIAKKLSCPTIYVDAVDTNERRFGAALSNRVPSVSFVSEHAADENYTVTGAASIIAKTVRDRRIRDLESSYGTMGSGYPSDARTISFVRDYLLRNDDFPPFLRRSWKTVQRLERMHA